MEPSSTDLRYFLEVIRVGSLSGAAVSCGISQPSLSLSIQRTEKYIGEKILIRGRRGAVPTAAGRALMSHAKYLLTAWEGVRQKVQQAENDLAAQIIIGCHPEVAIDSLPTFLPFLLESYPKLEVNLVHDLSRKITERVVAAEVDIGIVVNPRSHPDLVIKKLSSDEVNLWVGPGRRDIQSIDSGKAVLICDTELAQSQTLIRRADKKGLRFRRIIHTPDLQVACALVSSGAGIGILPSEVAQRNTHVALTRVPGLRSVNDEVALILRHENRRSKVLATVSDLIIRGHQRKYGLFDQHTLNHRGSKPGK